MLVRCLLVIVQHIELGCLGNCVVSIDWILFVVEYIVVSNELNVPKAV